MAQTKEEVKAFFFLLLSGVVCAAFNLMTLRRLMALPTLEWIPVSSIMLFGMVPMFYEEHLSGIRMAYCV